MAEVDYMMMALLGFFTGLGTTFGAEIAKTVFAKVNRLVEHNAKRDKPTV